MAVPPIAPAMLARIIPGLALEHPKEEPMDLTHIAAEALMIAGAALGLWAAWPARAARRAVRRALRREGTQ